MASLHTLFNWAVQNTPQPSETGDNNSNSNKFQDIPKEWIDAILASDADKMSKLIKIFLSEDSTLKEKEVALEDLEFYVQGLDNANDLDHPTVNGLKPLLQGLKSTLPTLRIGCAFVLGTALQNNPKIQQLVAQYNGLQLVLDAIEFELKNPSYYSLVILGKLFYVLTALVDNNTEIQMKFREFNGFSILGEILSKKPSYFDFPSELSSSQDVPTSTTDDIDEDDIPKDPNVNVVFDVLDRVKKTAKKRQEKGTISIPELHDDSNKLFLRLIKKIVFFIGKLLFQNEKLKLVILKDNSGKILSEIAQLLFSYTDDLDLVDKIVNVFEKLIQSENAVMKKYIIDELKKHDIVKNSLKAVAEKWSNGEDEDLIGRVNSILAVV